MSLQSSGIETISVIIPAINEAEQIAGAVTSALSGGAAQVFVVDGGSTDATVRLASQSGAVVLDAPAGRARQMNLGAERAEGSILLFLHADCRLPNDYVVQIAKGLLNSPASQAGVFRQRIAAKGVTYRFLEWGNTRRVLWYGLAYGDQAIWIRRETFAAMGGFPDVPLMEDYIFSEHFRKKNKFLVLPGPVEVNPRRWQKNGVIRQTLKNWRIIRDYRRGVPLEELKTRYHRHDQ